MRVFENRVLKRIFGPNRDEVTGNGKNYIMRCLKIFTPHQYYLCNQIKNNEMGWACSMYRKEDVCLQGFSGDI